MLTSTGTYGARLAIGFVAALIASWSAPAMAQTTAQIPLQFDFLPPGARSVAMGSAFVGAADDATAAFTNPAGLARLSERSVSAELRFKRLTTSYLSAGRVSGNITGIGLDTIPMPVYGEDVDDHFGPTFGSLLWPFGANTSVIGYAHQVAKIENAFSDQGVFFHFSAPGISDDHNRKNPVGGSRSVTITNYGGAVGYKFSDTFSVGGGVSFYRFRLDADFASFGITGNFAGPVNTSEVDSTAVQRGTDWSPAFNLGVLWDPIKNVKIGGAFRLGPGFDFSQHDQVPSLGFDLERHGTFKVPDVWSAGVQWTWHDVRVVVDYDLVRYGQLKTDFIDFQSLASNRPAQLRLDDGNEIHAGVEYLVPKAKVPVFLRGGFWRDPDHTVQYVPTPANDDIDVLYAATMPGGSAVIHYTFGGGVVATKWLELNAAADLSSRTKYATFSVVIRR